MITCYLYYPVYGGLEVTYTTHIRGVVVVCIFANSNTSDNNIIRHLSWLTFYCEKPLTDGNITVWVHGFSVVPITKRRLRKVPNVVLAVVGWKLTNNNTTWYVCCHLMTIMLLCFTSDDKLYTLTSDDKLYTLTSDDKLYTLTSVNRTYDNRSTSVNAWLSMLLAGTGTVKLLCFVWHKHHWLLFTE